MAVLEGNGDIVVKNHMQHHVVVGVIGAVMMEIPVGGFDMNLDIADPESAAHTHSRVKKIGTGIAVEDSGTLHHNRKPFHGMEFAL
jgi:hypothetical protein